MKRHRIEPYPLNFSTQQQVAERVNHIGPVPNEKTPVNSDASSDRNPGPTSIVSVETVFWVIIFTSLAGGLFGCFYTF